MSIKERIIADDKKRECLLLFFLFQFMQIMFDKATTRLTRHIGSQNPFTHKHLVQWK